MFPRNRRRADRKRAFFERALGCGAAEVIFDGGGEADWIDLERGLRASFSTRTDSAARRLECLRLSIQLAKNGPDDAATILARAKDFAAYVEAA